MPVVTIRALQQPPEVVERVLTAVTEHVAAALGEDPRGSWATWEEVAAYVEGYDLAGVQPHETHPPLVRITAFEGRSDDQIAAVLEAAAAAVAQQLGVEPGNVFAVYEEARSGRVFTGGRVVRRS